MAVELVVLDMAGTTVYDGDAVNRCLRQALAEVGLRVERDAVNRVMGRPKPLAIRALLEGAGDGRVEETVVAGVHRDFMARMIEHYRHHPEVAEAPGAGRAFATLRARGVKVVLDTGFNRPIVDVILARLGWSVPAVLDGSVASDEVARGRPHPDMIYRAMSLTQVHGPDRVAKVGDTPADLEQGHAAGCRLVIGVTGGSHTEAELRGSPHTHIVSGLEHLPPLVFSA